MDTIQPSTSCLARIPGTITALRTVLESHTPRATRELAQCLFDAKRLAQAKSDGPWVRIEYAGSGSLCGRISYSHADIVDYVLKKLTLRLLGRLGETFVTYGLCKKTISDQSADELYEALAPTTCLSSMMQADETGKSPPLCLQLIIKQHPTDEEKVSFIHEALRQATTDEQLLRILEIIGQINSQSLRLRRRILRDNIQYFLNVPYLKIAEQITDILWKDQTLEAIALKLIPNNLIKALEIAEQITDILWKDQTLEAIALKLIPNNLIKALEIAQQITYDILKNQTLEAIALKLVEKKNFIKALEIAQQITINLSKDQVLKAIVLEHVKEKNLIKALKVAQQITLPGNKDRALEAIALKLVEENNLIKALEVAQQITCLRPFDRVLEAIVLEHVKESKFKEAHKIVRQITIPWSKNCALEAIAQRHVEEKNLIKALEVAQLITNASLKNSVLKAIEKKDQKANSKHFTQVNKYSRSDVYKAYMLSVISKIAKVVCFTILSLIAYRLITSIRNIPPLQLSNSSPNVKA